MTTIGIDIDGILANYIDSIIQSAHAIGEPIDAPVGSLPTTYSMVEPGWFTSKDHWLHAHEHTMRHADAIKPLVTPDVFQPILDDGHALLAVTARDSAHDETRAWLEEYFPRIFSTVIFTDQKHDVPFLRYLVEDNPHAVPSPDAQTNTVAKVILLDYPYNQECSPYKRISSLQELPDFFQKMP